MTLHALGQSTEDAKLLLDAVASKMEGYENMEIKFRQTLVNEDAGIYDGDEAPINYPSTRKIQFGILRKHISF